MSKIITIEWNQVSVEDRNNSNIKDCSHIFTKEEFETIIGCSLEQYQTVSYEPDRNIFITTSPENKILSFSKAQDEPLLKIIDSKINEIIFETEKALMPNKEFINNAWVDKPLTIDEVRASKLLTINTECNKAIVSGFKSSALGEEYFYYSTLEEQTTLNSLINLGFDSNFKAQKISLVEGVEIKGERKQYPHTLSQLREILIAGATHIKAQIDKKDLLENQINSEDITIEELELIKW